MVKPPDHILPFPQKPTDLSDGGLALACIVVAIVPKEGGFSDDEYNEALAALEDYTTLDTIDGVVADVMKDPRMRNFEARVGYSGD